MTERARAYFNHAGLSLPAPVVRDRMRAAEELYQDHLFSEAGIELYYAVLTECRAALGRLLGLDSPAGVSILANASTAVQLVLTALAAELKSGDTIITSDQEHPCVTRPLTTIARRGAEVIPLATSNESEFLARLEDHLRVRRPAFAILSHVSYKNGRILPVEVVGDRLARDGIPYIVDGAQAFGHIAVDVRATHAWAYIFSGHKWLRGPWGSGGLWTSQRFAAGNRITAGGWLDQHDPPDGGRYEGGTMSYAVIAGLTEAARLAAIDRGANGNRLATLRDGLRPRLEHLYRLADATWGGQYAPGIISCLMPPGLTSWSLAERLLGDFGVAVKPFRPPEIPDAIRISYSPSTTAEEINLLIEALRRCLAS